MSASSSSEITPSARRMMLALESYGLDAVAWRSLVLACRPMDPTTMPYVAEQLRGRGWVEIAGMDPTRWIRLTSAGLNALAMKSVML